MWHVKGFILIMVELRSAHIWGDYYVGIMLCAPPLMPPIYLSCKTNNTYRMFSIDTIFTAIDLYCSNFCMNSQTLIISPLKLKLENWKLHSIINTIPCNWIQLLNSKIRSLLQVICQKVYESYISLILGI